MISSSSQNILCAVNVQHNCARYKCAATGHRVVRQERTLTTNTVPEIEHQGPLEDVLLNLYQMRSSRYLQHFRGPLPELNTDQIIHDSTKKEVDTRKSAQQIVDLGSPRLDQRSRSLRVSNRD